ncbi:MAG TPA: MFS transporter [Clostridiaceae bacterium]|nr:MFS transporter [Clostridiaceae bacterium]
MENAKSYNKLSVLTVLIVLGMFFLYIAQMNPSAVLTMIEEEYGIDAATSGLGVSIIFIPIILFQLVGSYIQDRIGLKKMYICSLLTGGLGIMANLIANSFLMFCVGRVLYGIGFGLSTPFIGAAIMHWYNPKQQVTMDTVNALFPYFANVLVFGLTIPLVTLFGGSWQASLSLWGFLCIIVLIAWVIGVKDEGPLKIEQEETTQSTDDKSIYGNIIKRKEIIILLIAFVCDFISYSIISILLPTYFQRDHGFSIELANNLTLIFPIAGIAGGLIAYAVMARTGRRKTLLWLGQAMKVVGAVLIYVGKTTLFGYAGIALVGMGNCIWIPPMFVVPMELEGMTPTRVGAAFSLITSCGFAAGFIAPVIAGWLSASFSYGFAIFLCAFPCLIGLIACLMIRETGPGAKQRT